jgi:hypothetical protein
VISEVLAMDKLDRIILLGWECYQEKVANHLLEPDSEKMMQMQLSHIYSSLSPLFEFGGNEDIKVLLEVPFQAKPDQNLNIDIVLTQRLADTARSYAIELKCFRLNTRSGTDRRGAQNLGMFDYWKDIERIEAFTANKDYFGAYQFTITDDPYYVEVDHAGPQVKTYSTYKGRTNVCGSLEHDIAHRGGKITLRQIYGMDRWKKNGEFYSIHQAVHA